jgi:hypothetical protein
MNVRGIEKMTLGELVEEVRRGGRFVVFHWCLGLAFKTRQRPSAIRFVGPGQSAGRGGWCTLGTFLTGWWAVPFGPSDTFACLRENLAGGRDVTAIVLQRLLHIDRRPAAPTPTPITSHAA